MSKYKLKIIDNGRYARETILSIIDSNTKKIKLQPIYTIGLFPTYAKTKKKKIPSILNSKTFKKILELIIEDKIRYIETNINKWSIKFYTRNPNEYKYQYNLKFSNYNYKII